MSHECEDCGQEFDTLSALRLHDCSPSTDGPTASAGSRDSGDASETVEIPALDEGIADAQTGEFDSLHGAIATYETRLAAAEGDQYRSISRAYREPLVAVLDDATQSEGWAFLAAFTDAYYPATGEEFPHVTDLLQNVVGRLLIRTRLTDEVDAIPAGALEYFRAILHENPDGYSYIAESLHPYGWGIGHPEHPVADEIHDHATRDLFVVNPMLEHAFYADQHAAVDLLERLADDESIQHTFEHPGGEMSEVRHLLDAPAGAASEFSPTIPRYWDWGAEFEYSFELDETVEERIRDIVTEHGLDSDLPEDWAIVDLTL